MGRNAAKGFGGMGYRMTGSARMGRGAKGAIRRDSMRDEAQGELTLLRWARDAALQNRSVLERELKGIQPFTFQTIVDIWTEELDDLAYYGERPDLLSTLKVKGPRFREGRYLAAAAEKARVRQMIADLDSEVRNIDAQMRDVQRYTHR